MNFYQSLRCETLYEPAQRLPSISAVGLQRIRMQSQIMQSLFCAEEESDVLLVQGAAGEKKVLTLTIWSAKEQPDNSLTDNDQLL